MMEPASLVASLRADQRTRWRRGDAVRVEAYLDQHTSLRAHPEAILDLILNEVALRQERGEAPELTEYLGRFSPLRAQLPALFQASRTHVVAPPSSPRPAVPQPLDLVALSDVPVVPGYEIVAELGRGGMGVVYQARQCALKRLVALKMILAGPHADPATRARFRTEAEAVARLQHPNIVQIYEVGEHDGRPFLCLEYVAGGSLEQKVAGVAQPEREAAQLVETVARAVHHAHERGILHRDLKPANILLQEDLTQRRQGAKEAPTEREEDRSSSPLGALAPWRELTPKLTDFGLAKLLDADGGPTRTQALIGTPSYMSPEQAAGNPKKVGVPADVYSLGAILYELLTGRAPFRGTSVLNTLEQVRTRDPVPPRRWRGPVSPDLETVCLKCLEKEPGNRYPSARALADDLRCFLGGEPIQARPVPAWQRLGRSLRRHPALVAWALAAVALVGVLLTTGMYWRGAGQRARHRAEEKYQQFVRYRDDAFFYGLLSPDQGALFLGAEAAANRQAADSAAREALALAGIEPESEASRDPGFPAARQAEVPADGYALLLLLASVRGQQPSADPGSKEASREALRILERARRLGFQTRAYHLRRAHLLEQLGEREEARKDRERAASLPPEGALDHFLLGEELYRRGDAEAARNAFDRALAVQPGHFWAQFFLAVCQLKAQRWEAAKAGLNACLTQRPDFVWVYLFRSFADEKLQARAEAEADFQKALALHPNADARYVLFLTRGILHFNQGELRRAEDDFRSALALKPDQYNAYLNLAQVYLAERRFDQAAEQVQQALRLRSPAAVVFGYRVERGRNLLRDRRYEEAVAACDAARQLAPEHPLPDDLRGRALLALGRHADAERSFDDYLRKGGEPVPDVFRGRGLARMRLGRYPEAAEDYTRALERAPDAELYQHRGWAHFFADAWRLALRDFAKAVELDPDNGDAYTGRGLARVLLGQYREAVADAEAARRRPGTPEMRHNLACIFAQAVARAEADREADDRQALVEEYRGRALEALHEALELVRPEERRAFWRDKVLPDAALAPIRNDPAFKRLADEQALGHEGAGR
jgi:eukaryotic-like serine/threonine-protein kinase